MFISSNCLTKAPLWESLKELGDGGIQEFSHSQIIISFPIQEFGYCCVVRLLVQEFRDSCVVLLAAQELGHSDIVLFKEFADQPIIKEEIGKGCL